MNLNGLSCYHAQQCAEKYLKAWLVYNKVEVVKTHNIDILIEQCIILDYGFTYLKDIESGRLSGYAIEARYPGDWIEPSREETTQAIALAITVKAFVREKLKKAGLEIVE